MVPSIQTMMLSLVGENELGKERHDIYEQKLRRKKGCQKGVVNKNETAKFI